MKSLKPKTARLLAIIVAIVMLFAVMTPVVFYIVTYAANSDSTRQQINNSQNKANQAMQNINKAKKAREQTIDDIRESENRINALEQQLEGIEAELARVNSELTKKQEELELAVAEAEAYNEDFKERVRVLYEVGPVTYLELILSAENFSDLLFKIESIREIASHDRAVLDKMELIRKSIEEEKAKVEELVAAQEAAVERQIRSVETLNEQKAEKEQMLLAIENDIEANEKVYQQEQAAIRQLEAQLEKLLSTSSTGKTYVGGEFLWPAQGGITSSYGMRVHPITGTNRMHTGIDIGAPMGAPMLASNNGTVVFSGWNGGYGNCVIIDHGGGRSTLYAHMQKNMVSVGDEVDKGQQVGAVGSTGNSTGPHAHFEIRINGQHQNPMNYFN